MKRFEINKSPDVIETSLFEQLRTMKFLWPYLWPADKPSYKLRVIGAFAITFLAQFIAVGAPLMLGHAVNRVSQDNPEIAVLSSIAAFIVGYGMLRLASVAVPQLREFLFATVGQNAQREVALNVFRHLHALSLRFHLERRTGGLSRIIERGIRSIDFLFRFLLFNIIPTFIQLFIVSLLFALEYRISFALIAMATVGFYFWFTVSSTEWRLKFRRQMNEKDTEANTKAVDSLLNYETVKYFNNESFEVDRYNVSMQAYQKAAVKSSLSLTLVNFGQALVFNLGLVLILILTAQSIGKGDMQIGAMTAISLIMMNLYQPLNILGFAYREIKQALVDMEKMFSLLKEPAEVEDKENASALQVQGGGIRFEDVQFQYEDSRKILKGISFVAEPGQKVALVGHSGAGKSTVSRILYRFYDISSGRVLIDEQDIRDVTQNSLRKAIGMVPQDTVLFNDTIAYNIAYAKPGATQDDIEQAAKLAQIDDFVQSLPDGYNTLVGERGLKLSGGEKQRVAIARTILKDPPILILDEATSALDSVTERDIQNALTQVAASRTTIVIAHRLSTIIDADLIIVLEDGMIAEQGTHDELLARDGVYANLWQQQRRSSEPFEPIDAPHHKANQNKNSDSSGTREKAIFAPK